MLMNRELAAYLVASTQEDFAKRQFWFNAASQFHAIHLAHGKMYVDDREVYSAENLKVGLFKDTSNF